MIEVPQEEFSIDKFKELNTELRNNVARPSKEYQEALRRNPRHVKQLTTIEDFVTILPTSAETEQRLSENDFYTNEGTEEEVPSSVEEPIVLDYSTIQPGE